MQAAWLAGSQGTVVFRKKPAREDSPMNISVKQVLPIGLLLLLPVQKPAKADVPKIPKGIYAVVPIEEVLTKGYPGVQGFGYVPSSPSAAADGFLMTLFESY
jgi:hypothetical protein